MIFKYSIYILALFTLVATTTKKRTKVVATTPDVKWIVEKIGGDKIVVESLLGGRVDPHHVEATPHFVGKAANADAFCLVGLGLEIGWVPRVLSRSGNKNVQPGGIGYCDLGSVIKAMDIPKGSIDRSMGDVHPEGNPHYYLGPTSFLRGGKVVLNVLTELDASNAEFYSANYKKLEKEMKEVKANVFKMLLPLKGKKIMEYHKEFAYFMRDFGLANDGSLEELPGIPPSAGRLARVTIQAKERNVALLMATEMSPRNTIRKFSEVSKVPVAVVPSGIRIKSSPNNYSDLLKSIAEIMINSYKNAKQ